MIRISSFLLTMIVGLVMHAQVSIGTNYNHLKILGDYGTSNPGLGVFLGYNNSEKSTIILGYNHSFSSSENGEIISYATSNQTYPGKIDIDTKFSYTYKHAYIGVRGYFIGDNEGEFGFYGDATAGLLIETVDRELLEEFDETSYPAKSFTANYLGPTVNFGLGLEKHVKIVYLFTNLHLNLPATSLGGGAVEVEIPVTLGVNFGVRFPFN